MDRGLGEAKWSGEYVGETFAMLPGLLLPRKVLAGEASPSLALRCASFLARFSAFLAAFELAVWFGLGESWEEGLRGSSVPLVLPSLAFWAGSFNTVDSEPKDILSTGVDWGILHAPIITF